MANISSLSDMRKREEAGGGGGGGGDEDDPEFYVGGNSSQGGGGSGLNVIDPVTGSGGDDPMGGLVSAAQAQSSGGPAGSSEGGTRKKITIYKDGFVVDDGEFRPLSDPANRQFIAEMQQSRVPAELQEGAAGGMMEMHLEDKHTEAYEPPAYKAYSGAGQTIGGATEVSAGALAGAAEDNEAELPVVDEAQPKAMVAVRLHNGKRMKATLNNHHTVLHLQALIEAEGAGGAPYVLLSGYPPAQITDFSQTIADAKLNGAQVTQKLA